VGTAHFIVPANAQRGFVESYKAHQIRLLQAGQLDLGAALERERIAKVAGYSQYPLCSSRSRGYPAPMSKLWIAAGAVVGALVLSTRRELQRYLMIRRADHDPSVVGQSITPQGNLASYHKNKAHRRGPGGRLRAPRGS
jgi:hypothetical protein